MGWFSFLGKNKQEATKEDSGFYSPSSEQSSLARARAKRSANTVGSGPRRNADDSVLPAKKRARRRLVGAVVLALTVAVGLPMILDSEPKPLASDIAILIPSNDKPAAPEPMASAKIAASPTLDTTEKMVALPEKPIPAAIPTPAPIQVPAPTPTPIPVPALSPNPTATRTIPPLPTIAAPHADSIAKAAAKAEAAQAKAHAESLARAAMAEPAPVKAEIKHQTKLTEAKPVAKPAPKDAEETSKPADDAMRALAILEAKPAAKSHAATPGKFVVQVAALAAQDKVDELQAKLAQAGISSYTQKLPTPTGQRTRIRVGPFDSKEEAEKVRAKLIKIGLSGNLVPA